MAEIILDPGEEFEHYHVGPSTTTLIDGRATLTMQGATVELIHHDAVPVPPNTPHVLRNTGGGTARVACSHAPTPVPPAVS
jgi:quercetin dioxygenase-like cupin family protein